MTHTVTVLLVDDDPDLLDLVAEALQMHDYEVVTAHHGLEALERIEQGRPQLILLDMRMPIMDGWAFAAECRRLYGHEIPIVVVTAAEDVKRRAEEVGAEGYLGKPFNLRQLYDVIERNVGERTP